MSLIKKREKKENLDDNSTKEILDDLSEGKEIEPVKKVPQKGSVAYRRMHPDVKTMKENLEKSSKMWEEMYNMMHSISNDFLEMKKLSEENNKTLKTLVKTDEQVHEGLKEDVDVFDKVCDEAKKISKDEGVVQHVNEYGDNNYKIENFYDADKTVISYENGLKL